MISIPKPRKEPSFRDAVRKIVLEEMKGYGEVLRRLEADVDAIKKTVETLRGAGAKGMDADTFKGSLSELREKFSKVISEQESRIAGNARAIKFLESRMEDAGTPAKPAKLSQKAVDDVKSDLKTLEKNVFEQFDQMHKNVDSLTTALDAKTRDFSSMMDRLSRFHDEARTLNSENFVRGMSSMKLRLDRLEKAVAELGSRGPVVIE
jgi:chromosome segregation ATPase